MFTIDCRQFRAPLRVLAVITDARATLTSPGAQFGRLNGLAAYALQERGIDTLDADALLGFRTDERTYQAAAEMLCQLSVTRVRLMTDSPQ